MRVRKSKANVKETNKMQCLNCGGNIPDGAYKCPYCGNTLQQSKRQRDRDNDMLAKRFVQIDDAFSLHTDYTSMPTDKLQAFLAQIEEKFDEYKRLSNLTSDQISKINEHIYNIDEYLQECRLPLRAGLRDMAIQLPNSTIEERVNSLINYFNPPDVYSAAFNLRCAIEKKLRDYYKLPYNSHSESGLPFGKAYVDIFSDIIRNRGAAENCAYARHNLNYFVHSCEENERQLNRHYPLMSDKVNFILSSMQLFLRYNLI
jgi:predicted RNA-binding Zn-ribbon protein involved in translation (DUF1610 family)